MANNETEKYRYIKIPIPLIRLMLVKPRESENVLRYAVWMKAQDIEPDMTNVFRQILYVCLKKHGEGIPFEVMGVIERLEEDEFLGIDYDHEGFTPNGDFDDEPIYDIERYAESDEHFKEMCVRWYQIRQLCNFLGLQQEEIHVYEKAYDNISQLIINEEIYDNEKENEEIYTSAKIDIFKRYIQLARGGRVPEYERIQFACYMALKSIVGKNDYKCATKELILARMFGLRSSKDITSDFLSRRNREEIKRLYKKYSTRRNFTKLLSQMLEYGYLKCCFGARKKGYYISTKLTENEVMTKEIERLKSKIIKQNKMQEAGREFAQNLKKMKDSFKPLPF